MSKAQFDIYVRKVMDLAQSLVLKSSASADAINDHLRGLGHTVGDSDPSLWKYYLNLAGRYHATDRTMTVTSLDTLQTISFTQENLQEHRATLREYAAGTQYFRELLAKYPDQEMLIRGILNPVPFEVAYKATDGDVLYYDAGLVESNETNLIPQLQQWTRGFMHRWNVPAYNVTDDLYAAGQLAVLFANVPLVIMNLRLGNCHTQYAHSFHIREYLASNGKLDEYVDFMTKKQMLTLYRNIRYIHRNAGKKATFEYLMQILLTDRGLPLAEWDMRHNLKDLFEEITPDVEFVRHPLNFGYNSAGGDTMDVGQMLEFERPAAGGNLRVEKDLEAPLTQLFEHSLKDKLKTKVLESAVLDLTDSLPYTRSDCLLNHWMFLSFRDLYKAVVVVNNPKTGGRLALTVQDAFLVYLYCHNLTRGLRLETIPALEAINVRKLTPPTLAQLRSVVESRLVDDVILHAAVDAVEPIGSYISTATFHESMVRVHQGQLVHRWLYATQEHMGARAQVEQATSSFYHNAPCRYRDGQVLYSDWFQELGLDIPEFSELEAGLLAEELLASATGVNLKDAQSLKEMQAAMLRLMAQLSSYSVQFLQTINTDPIQMTEWNVVRVGDDTLAMGDDIQASVIDVRVEELHARARMFDPTPLQTLGFNYLPQVRALDTVPMDPTLELQVADRVVLREYVDIRPIDIIDIIEVIPSVQDDTPDRDTENYLPAGHTSLTGAFTGLNSPHYSLSDEDRALIRSRWPGGSPSNPIQYTLTVGLLDGFEYPPLVDLAFTQLDGFDYPELIALNGALNGFEYPTLTDAWGGLNTLTMPGFDYPELIALSQSQLDGFYLPDTLGLT